MSVCKVLEIFEKENIVEHVKAVGPYLSARLDELTEKTDCILERRGKGLMQGLVLTKPFAEVNLRALEEGLLVLPAEGNVLRLLPPLIIEEKHVDEMIEKLEKILA